MREWAWRIGEGENAPEHLVGAEGMRDPVLAEDLQGRRRFEGAEYMDGRAGCDEAEQARHAEGAAERQHGQQRMTLVIELERVGDGGGVRCQRPLRMRDELRPLGGAGSRVEQDRQVDIILNRGGGGIGPVEGVEPHTGPVRGDRIRADHGKLLQRGHLVAGDIGEDGGKIDRAECGLDHHQPGTGHLEQVRDFRAAVARVDGSDDRAKAGGGEQQRDPFDPVDQPDRDHVPLADALRREPGRGLLDSLREPRARDRRAVEHEGGFGGLSADH